jgi:hypothetical protein
MPNSDTSIGTKSTSTPWLTKQLAAGGEIDHLLIRSSLASIRLAVPHPRALIVQGPLIPLQPLRRSNVHLNLLRGDRKVLYIHIPRLWRHDTAKCSPMAAKYFPFKATFSGASESHLAHSFNVLSANGEVKSAEMGALDPSGSSLSLRCWGVSL